MFQRLSLSSKAPWPCVLHARLPRRASYRRHPVSCEFTPQSKDAASLDVSGAVVIPVFRSSPNTAAAEERGPGGPARILFVSESGVCRAPLALAYFCDFLEQHGLAGEVEVAAKASRDYNVGDCPEAAAVSMLQWAGGPLPPPDYRAALFDPAADIVSYDLVLVFDKFTAADVLREVSVFDTIHSGGNYSQKVRRLGEFHPKLAAKGADPDAQDIPDALYGNLGGEDEQRAVAQAAQLIEESCRGLVQHLLNLQQQQGPLLDKEAAGVGGEGAGVGGSCLREKLAAWLGQAEAMQWLVPPMLQGSYVWDNM